MTRTFTNNFSGIRASSINMFGVFTSRIVIDRIEFKNETGAFSLFEKLYKLPFYEHVASQKYSINYLSNSTKKCMDEISIRFQSDCEDKYTLYPIQRGVMYFKDVQIVNITNCNFTQNDGGPVMFMS